MDNVIRSQPLLVQKNLHYIQITVHRVQAVHSAYNVLFLGTGECLFRVDISKHKILIYLLHMSYYLFTNNVYNTLKHYLKCTH